MSFIDRDYPQIVRDVLTTLTQGVSGEVHRVSYSPTLRPVVVPDVVLARRPVARVSFVEGQVADPKDPTSLIPYVFGLSDYELVPAGTDPDDRSAIRFLPFGRRPAPDTDIRVSYYPRTTDKAAVTDLNVGSVVRTLVEAMSKELGILYRQLDLVYDAGFVESATASSLDRVVALLGLKRFRAGRPAGTVTFGRRAGLPGLVVIPAGTPVTDATDKIAYQTVQSYEMLPGESSAEVAVRGTTDNTPAVEAGVLTVVQEAIAGIDGVSNQRPTTRSSDDETDEALRARARSALLASNKGTVAAIESGLLLLPEVRDVHVREMPNGIPGEIEVAVSLAAGPTDTLPPSVLDRIEALRPAGVHVISRTAKSTALTAGIKLVLAGASATEAEREAIRDNVRQTLTKAVTANGVGQKIRIGTLVAALLGDQRIVDAGVALGPKDGAAPTPGQDVDIDKDAAATLDEGDISFAAETFAEPPPVGQPVAVEVRATVAVQLIAGTRLDDAKAQITARLGAFFGRLLAGSTVDTPTLLQTLRDDSKYAIDPGRLSVTLVADDQFVQILQGGPAYTVKPAQTFTVTAPEVTA